VIDRNNSPLKAPGKTAQWGQLFPLLMSVQIHSKTLSLSPEQQEYLQKKAEKILHYSRRAADESSSIRIHIEREDTKSKEEQIHCVVNIIIPHATLHAESRGRTVEETIDLTEEKLNRQIDEYKAKMQ